MNELNEDITFLPKSIAEDAVEARIHILEKIASTLDVEEVLRRIVEAAIDLTKADEGTLLLLDDETGELTMRAAQGFGEDDARSFRQPVTNDTVAGRVILTGRPVLLDPKMMTEEPVKVKTGYFATSVLNLPIKHGDETIGVLGVYNSSTQRPFTYEHLMLLTPLTSYAAIAIENARRHQKTEELLVDAYSLFDIAGLFTETRDLIELLHLVASLTLGRLDAADRVVIHLLDGRTGRLEYMVRIPPPRDPASVPSGFAVGEGVAGQVVRENRPVNISDIKNEPAFVARDVNFSSLLVAPISWRSACIGTISVVSPQKSAF